MFLQFVIVSLSGWGLLIFSGYKFFTGGKGKKEEVISNELFLSSYRESSVIHDVISIMEWLSGMSIANIG